MDLETFRELLTPAGQRALKQAVAMQPTEASSLACIDALRKYHGAAFATAALETALLRLKARDKFPDADRMYFTSESLEQSTSAVIARHRAGRFIGFGHVADLCCGIGADALALASSGLSVDAVDVDPLRVAMLEANALALGLQDRVRATVCDALMVPLLEAKAVFADPNRRAAGRRHLNPEDYTPSLSELRDRFAPRFPLAVKIAPGVARSDIPANAESEFISLRGEMKECVLWFGPLRGTARRATLLPSCDTLAAEVPRDSAALVPVGAVVYDPDAAVTRAGLVHDLAERIGAEPIDFEVQLLTSKQHAPTPFATVFRVEHAAPFHAKHLRDYLREHRVGRVTLIKRGSPADADVVLKKLKLDGPNHRTLLLTRAGGVHTAIVCERLN